MEKFKKMTYSLKRDLTSPTVRLLGVKSDKNDAADSLDDDDIAYSSDSLLSQDSSTKKVDTVEREGKHFLKKLAVNLSLTKKGKDLRSKTKLFPASSGNDEEHDQVATEEKTSVSGSESDSFDDLPDELSVSEDTFHFKYV